MNNEQNILGELIRFAKWWEENIGDAADDKYFYWNDKRCQKFTVEEICKRYLKNIKYLKDMNDFTVID